MAQIPIDELQKSLNYDVVVVADGKLNEGPVAKDYLKWEFRSGKPAPSLIEAFLRKQWQITL